MPKDHLSFSGGKRKLFVVYGASGSGKSTIINLVSNLSDKITVHCKDTTRKPRKGENIAGTKELRFVEKVEGNDYKIIYEQYGYLYGIRKDQLEEAYKNDEIHFVIINNVEAIKKFKSIYPYSVVLYIHTVPESLPDRLVKRDEDEYKERYSVIEQQYRNFINNNTLFDYVILNFWELENSKIQLENIIKEFID